MSQQVTDQDDEGSWYFIVTREQKYLGLGSVRALLKRITESKLQNARYANPLTLLPGNVPIYREIDGLLQRRTSFHIAYFDLNDFKPYNDTYGYSKGDLVIELLAQIIQSESDTVADFIGHIGGDDFIVLFGSDQAEATSALILKRFEQRVKHYYLPEHVQQGGFSAMDRLGVASFYPLITLSIGLATPDPLLCRSHHDVAALASAAKQQAKKQTGASIFINKRRAPDTTQSSQNTVLPQTNFA